MRKQDFNGAVKMMTLALNIYAQQNILKVLKYLFCVCVISTRLSIASELFPLTANVKNSSTPELETLLKYKYRKVSNQCNKYLVLINTKQGQMK